MSQVGSVADAAFIARFWSKVNQAAPGRCWLWRGGLNRGYGQVSLPRQGGVQSNTSAHRVSWMLTRGPIPDGLFVCHRCDTPACVNPAHLFLGTQKNNLDDARRKGRLIDGIGARKLTLADYRLILGTNARGVDLAQRLGVSEVSIARIRMGIQGAVLGAQVREELRQTQSRRSETAALARVAS